MAILTVTLNPALDLETTTPHLQPAEKLRCEEPTRDPGGGGLNVARAVVQLGGEAVALAAAGGPPGEALLAMMEARGVRAEALPAPGELRQNLSVIEEETGKQYRFIFPGPTWSDDDLEAAVAALEAREAEADWLVISGSLPPGVAPGAMPMLIKRLSAKGTKLVLDTSGDALRAVAEHPGHGLTLLRMDREEAEALAGRDLPDAADSADFAADLVARGVARMVICARGADGSVLANAEGRWQAPAADVPMVSRTGAGDSFVAGTVLALSQGMDPAQVLERGCAAASAACTTPATALCDAGTVAEIMKVTRATPV